MNRQTLRIAVLDEDANAAARVEALVRGCGFGVRRHDVTRSEDLDPTLRDRHPDLVFYDLRHGHIDLDDLVAVAREMDPPPQLIGLRHGPRGTVARYLERGLDDVVSLLDEEHLQGVIRRSARCQAERHELRRLRAECAAMEQRCALLLEKQEHAIAYLHDGIHVYANLAWKELFGFAPTDELEGLPIMDILPEDEQEPVRLFLKQHRDQPDNAPAHLRLSLEGKDGKPQPLRMECSPVRYEGEDCLQLMLRPVTAADTTSQLTQQLNYLAIYDIASGLYTRNYLVEQLEKTLVKARHTRERHALVMISLDNYERLAAQLGIAEADLLYADIGTELKTQLSLDDILCRHDTSTYGLITATAEPEALEVLLHQLIISVNEQTFHSGSQPVRAQLSCGAAIIDEHARDAYTLMSTACEAAHRAGQDGSHVVLATPGAPAVPTPRDDDERWSEYLREALKEGRLRLFFQPVVPAHDREQRHIEASLRIARPEGGYFHPAEFMPSAIRTGYAKGLDRWVILRSLKMLQRYGDQIGPQGLLVQLTEGLLYQENDPDWFARQLAEHEVVADYLVLELRLGDVLRNLDHSSDLLRGLADQGCRLCIADCQDTDERLDQIEPLPVHYLKVDEALVQHLAADLERRGALNRLIRRAHQLGQKVIVPGLLDAEQLDIVKELDVDFLQGDFLQPASEELPIQAPSQHPA